MSDRRRRGLVVALLAALLVLAGLTYAMVRLARPEALVAGVSTTSQINQTERVVSAMQGGGGGMMRVGDGDPAKTPVRSIAAARARVRSAFADLGLHPGEIIWFHYGFYVELKDSAGKSATEVLVSPTDGSIMTEPGPAMMWNTKYSPRRMMNAGVTGAPRVSVAAAKTIAQAWLAKHLAGTTAATIDEYPGYYTVDVASEGITSGMLSVNASTGEVWYHTWHGSFITQEDS
jgi:hypothetical protein